MSSSLAGTVKKIVVLASGAGSNFQALADWAAGMTAGVEISALVSDISEAAVLARAEKMGIPALCLEFRNREGMPRKDARRLYDRKLADLTGGFEPDFIFLLGWMRILSDEFVGRFPGKIINLHPALPGQFPGTHAIERAYEAFRENRIIFSGVMTHYVPDEGIDSGPVVAVQKVAIFQSDNLETFEHRIHEAEHFLVVHTAELLIGQSVPFDGHSDRSDEKGVTTMPRALFSVYDKTGLDTLARGLAALGWKIIASGGTSNYLAKLGIPVTQVEELTKSPEFLGGRVKTLHPAIHGGILARDTPEDMAELENRGFNAIDLVVVNLYPFVETISKEGCSAEEAIEQIDIGGVALIRAAAKNHDRVTLLTDPSEYDVILREIAEKGSTTLATRKKLAAQGFELTARYDSAITAWLSGGDFAAIFGTRERTLRYGENPHQKAELYVNERGTGPLGGKVLQGKELSYNNILDLDAAWQAASRFSEPCAVVVKHLSPCGIAAGDAIETALSEAIACDPVSAYGGVIAVNRNFSLLCAKSLGALFVECIAAPAFDEDALSELSKKKNLRLVAMQSYELSRPDETLTTRETRSVRGGFLVQDIDRGDPPETTWKVVSKRAPSPEEMKSLRFAWNACVSVKSNAIVLVRGTATVGIGGGQPNRVDSVRIAASRAGERTKGSVLASDAFFPFPDSVEEAAKAGVTAIVHPGGSIRDAEAVAVADAAGMAMVISGIRHFRH
jgi:phosphoribosylaminoimidazolecarboxamide formyltransferase/IMP cyclohydrolase